MDKDKQIETSGKEDTTKLTQLEQIWGLNEMGRYGTSDLEAYSSKLNDMNRPELERHARSVGVLVVESSARLKENLQKEFRNYFLLLHKPSKTSTGVHSTSNPKVADEVKKILAEGR